MSISPERFARYVSPLWAPRTAGFKHAENKRTSKTLSQTENTDAPTFIMELTAQVVVAYVSNNSLPAADLPATIATVYNALGQTHAATRSPENDLVPERPDPAVPIKRSVTDDHIICLEDGKTFKSMKRHLMTEHQMTPDEYRERWDLKPDYPMVAPAYAASRSRLAKSLGLGRKPAKKKR